MTKVLRWFYLNHKLNPQKFSIQELALCLGKSRNAVYGWIKGCRQIPDKHSIDIVGFMVRKIGGD